MWSLADHAENLRDLLDLMWRGDVRHIQLDLAEAFKQTYGKAFGAVRLALQEAFQRELEKAFASADFEAPCEILLRNLYCDADLSMGYAASSNGTSL